MALTVCRRLVVASLCPALLIGCTSDPTGPAGGTPAQLELASGNDQSGAAASELPLPIRVRVLDARGEPVAGVGVTFLADAGSGILSPATATTDADGIAAASWQLPAHLGSMTGQALVSDLDPLLLSATAIAGGAATVLPLSSPDVASDAGTALDTVVAVRVVDLYGNPVAGAAVSFTVSAGGGTLGTATTSTDAAGIARTTWRVSANAGLHTVRASAGGVTATAMTGAVFLERSPSQLSIGGRGGCAILEGLYCWGNNGGGQVGDGTTINPKGPVAIGQGNTWRTVAVGTGFGTGGSTCALNDAQQLHCWGTGLPGGTSLPTPVAGAPLARDVELGSQSACLLAVDGRVLCWGVNSFGQLGNGSQLPAAVPTPIESNERFRSVAMGNNFACAISEHGKLYCWGSNSAGQLGDGTQTARRLPVHISPERRFGAVRLGSTYSCAQELGGAWYCWGSDDWGRVSASSSSNTVFTAPRLLEGVPSIQEISLGTATTCVLTAEGAAHCWGTNGQWLLGDIGAEVRYTPGPVADPLRFKELDLGQYSACGVTNDDQLFCWGYNVDGGVGVPDRTEELLPVLVTGVPSFVQIAVADEISCGRTAAGQAWCWGSGHAPQPVAGGQSFTTIDAGAPDVGADDPGSGACGLATDGTAWCWGSHDFLGYGSGFDLTARPVAGAHTFSAIGVGRGWACGVDAGNAWCWGAARGTPSSDLSIPTRIMSTEMFDSLGVGWGGACARTPGGAAHCWSPSQNSMPPTTHPVQGAPPPFIDLNEGCGLAADGSVHCFGPAFPAGTFIRLAEGGCGIAPDGNARCWGNNEFGRLGVGVAGGHYATPQPIAGGVQIREVSLSAWHGCGLDPAGQTWCWGMDRDMALGNGARWAITSPQQVLPQTGAAR